MRCSLLRVFRKDAILNIYYGLFLIYESKMDNAGSFAFRMKGKKIMDFERYYLDLFDMLNSCCKKIASGKYDKEDSERLFELSKKGRYPSILAELAESFGMMLVKVEAREFERIEIIEELETAKSKLEDYSKKLEKEIQECCPEESRKT